MEHDQIYPNWVYRAEKWLPKSLIKGDLQALVNRGFKFYRVTGASRQMLDGNHPLSVYVHWYVALQPESGVGLAWQRRRREANASPLDEKAAKPQRRSKLGVLILLVCPRSGFENLSAASSAL